MRQRRARVLTPDDVRRLLAQVRGHRHALRDRTIILLSFKAGLRACEIAGLSWDMVLAADQSVTDVISLAGTVTKGGRARTIPLHKELRRSLAALHRHQAKPHHGAVIRSERSGHLTPRSIVNWFAATYQEAGLQGCSSHSGRRTFITTAAQQIARTGGSLRGIQELAGHQALTTTERYIEGNRAAQRKLISLL